MARPTGRDIKTEVLDEATAAIAQLGVSRLTYPGLAQRLGVQPTAIHHHFRRKEDLLFEVVHRYCQSFDQAVSTIEGATAGKRIEAYASIYVDSADKDWVCLCSAAATEWSTVSEPVRIEVKGFFDFQINWLEAQVRQGAAAGEFRPEIDPEMTAATIFSALEGVLLLVRAGRPATLATDVTNNIIGMLSV